LVRFDSHRIDPQCWPQRAYNSLQNITAEFAFGDWLYDVSLPTASTDDKDSAAGAMSAAWD
jgi:hypothetical protein